MSDLSKFLVAMPDIKKEENECVQTLLAGVPEEGTVSRETLESVIRCAFVGGNIYALIQLERLRAIEKGKP